MSLELIAAGKLLEMAFAGIVGNTATDGVKLLWQTIKNRLVSNQPDIKAEILKLEQNPTPENLKPLEPFLQVEMHKDKSFAEEISKLAQEIAQASGDNITVGEIKAETGGVAATTIDASNSTGFGGSYSNTTNINMGKT